MLLSKRPPPTPRARTREKRRDEEGEDDVIRDERVKERESTCKDVRMLMSEYEGVLYIRKRGAGGGRERRENSTVRELQEKGFVQTLQDHGYWDPIIGCVKFVVHFGLVMGLLFCGAWVFAMLEDPEVPPMIGVATNSSGANVTDLEQLKYEESVRLLWEEIEVKYNISLHSSERTTFLSDMSEIIGKDEERAAFLDNQKLLQDREFIWMKWFYFTTICTTTIGYGDVTPSTENGRLFYIFFSIFGIATMMTLMQSCGVIITKANKQFYGLLNRFICSRGGGEGAISQELLSVISITIIFFGFMTAGIWYDTTHLRQGPWTYVNVIYYWIVTFTTVGFDTPIDLRTELRHVYELLLYRLFGLSFLAGIIDSLKVYFDYRKELLKEKAKELKKLKESLKLKSGMSTLERNPLMSQRPLSTASDVRETRM